MQELLAARAQMGTSLAFHIIFSVLGVGLPFLLCLAEGLALWRKDPAWMVLAHRWAKAAVIIFAIGAVSGTIVEFELGLLWPPYIHLIGSVIGPLFAFEGFAFFVEAIFFGIYLYGWNRVSPFVHWLTSFPIWIGGLASAGFIVTTNSWMNTPTGFQTVNGRITVVNSRAAIFNPSTPYETVHMILACYAACGLVVAAVYAFAFLKGRRADYQRKGLLLGLAVGFVALPLQIISGDFNARYLARAQPVKLAAMEGVFHTGSHVPLHIGGIPDPQTQQYILSLDIPDGLSLLATYTVNGVIKGLDLVPRRDWPNLLAVHLAFDGMVGSALIALAITALFWLLYFWRQRVLPENRWLLRGVVVTGFLGLLAVELGWIVTEEGRQPWVIYGFLRVSQAVTTAPLLTVSFGVFVLLYIVLAITMIVLLIRQARLPLPEMIWSEVMTGPGNRHGDLQRHLDVNA